MKLFKNKTFFILFLILLGGFLLRTFNIAWDNGFYFHPDERAIILTVVRISLPQSFQQFLSIQSPLNTHFFAYGNFPMYLLYFISLLAEKFNVLFAQYSGMYVIARPISALFDTATILLVYLISRKVFSKQVSIFSALFYACALLPIQLSHFFAVDTILTFFITLTILLLLIFYEKPSVRKATFVGISFGFALSTKISAVPLLVSVLVVTCVDFFLVVIRKPHKPLAWLPHTPKFLRKLIKDFVIIFGFAILTFFILQPYVAIDSQEFINQNLAQSEMTRNAFIFPYTLQYVGKIPYLYELKNIFFWGLGPYVFLLSTFGFFVFLWTLFQKEKRGKIHKEIILLSFFTTYFIVVGHFAIGFIRYMLPLYPFFAIMAGLFASLLFDKLGKDTPTKILFGIVFVLSLLVYPVSFLTIYSKPSTRITASNWILKNIPYGSTLAVEHWDDELPVYGSQNYTFQTLELYNPDSDLTKWQKINNQLRASNYIILASPRLYRFLPKFTNCNILPPDRCYPQTAAYYHKLFNGQLGFKKVAEFTSFPTIPFTNIEINDSSADEAFSVYDHPKILIYKHEIKN